MSIGLEAIISAVAAGRASYDDGLAALRGYGFSSASITDDAFSSSVRAERRYLWSVERARLVPSMFLLALALPLTIALWFASSMPWRIAVIMLCGLPAFGLIGTSSSLFVGLRMRRHPLRARSGAM